MSFNRTVFFQRTASAAVFAVIMLVGLMWNSWSVMVLAGLIQFLCMREYFTLVQKMDPEAYWSPELKWIVQVGGLVWLFLSSVYFSYQSPWPAMLCAPAFIFLFASLPENGNWKAAMYAMAGFLYIVLPMMLLIQIHTTGKYIALAIVLMIWVSDTMAYLVGSLIGKTPFSPVSPNKTWEGIIGGGVLTIVTGGIFGYVSNYYNVYDWMILSLIVSITAPAGDLLQSKLKRIAGIKDTGNLMPGHGGALDRFDSLLVVLPFTFVYVWRFMPAMF